jgi:hypothetical protein
MVNSLYEYFVGHFLLSEVYLMYTTFQMIIGHINKFGIA